MPSPRSGVPRRERLASSTSFGDTPSRVQQRISQEETIASQQQTIEALTKRLSLIEARMNEAQELMTQMAADKFQVEQDLFEAKAAADKPGPSDQEWNELHFREMRAQRNLAAGSRHFHVAHLAFKEADARKKQAETMMAQAEAKLKEVEHLVTVQRAKLMQHVARLQGELKAEQRARRAAEERAEKTEAENKDLISEFRSYLEADRANAQMHYTQLSEGVSRHAR